MIREFSARLRLLDQQLVDADRLAIGRVDDIELAIDNDGGRPRATALLVGGQALGERLSGPVGQGMAGACRRLRPASDQPGPARVDPELVEGINPFVRLSVPFSELPALAGLERWLANRVVGRLPGAHRAVE